MQILVAAQIPPATCQQAAPNQTVLHLPSANVSVPTSPWGLAYASDDVAFVSLGAFVGVLNTSTCTPHLIRTIKLPKYSIHSDGSTDDNGAAELTISKNRKEVWVSLGPGAIVLDVEKALCGHEDAIIGELITPMFSSATQIVLSIDESYAFISQEYGSNATQGRGGVQVFEVNRERNGTISGSYIGFTELQYAVNGMALSANGKNIYVTSEATLASLMHHKDRGILSVLDVEGLKFTPSKALKVSVDAGCEPVRVAVSPDGSSVWVTARASNHLVVFDATKLTTMQHYDAQIATVQVGTSPIGLVFVNGGRQIITADSNRNNFRNATTGLTVVDIDSALSGKQNFARVHTGLFPRSFSLSSDGNTLLVSQFDSNAIQSINLALFSRGRKHHAL